MSNPRGWRDDPAWRHARAVKAGQAAKLAHYRRALTRAQRMQPAEAYAVGYRQGYQRAYAHWRKWGQRLLQQRVTSERT